MVGGRPLDRSIACLEGGEGWWEGGECWLVRGVGGGYGGWFSQTGCWATGWQRYGWYALVEAAGMRCLKVCKARDERTQTESATGACIRLIGGIWRGRYDPWVLRDR
jgi:hypothetical protein